MTDAARFEVRAYHVQDMNARDILAPWSTTVQPYPPFIQNNPRLLGKIRAIRIEAVRKIQEVVFADFARHADRLQNEGETLISTIDELTKGRPSASVSARLEHAAALVGKTKAELSTKLSNRRDFLAERQPTPQDWDNFFRYNSAYRKSKVNQANDFEVSPRDRRQADRDDADEVKHNLRDDSDREGQGPTQPQPHRKKRKRDQTPTTYRIPKKSDRRKTDQGRNQKHRSNDQHQHRTDGERREHYVAPPTTAPRRNQDFADPRPASTHRSTYYRGDHEGTSGRDNHQNRAPTRTHTHQRRDRDLDERDQQLDLLQRQLDRLRRA